MDDLPIAAPLRSNLPEYTVSELARALKRSIEENFAVVRVRGEISGFKRHGSGHCYLSLKDADAVIDAASLPKVRMPAHDRFVPDTRGAHKPAPGSSRR